MRRLNAILLVFAMLGGCSFALVSGPPANHRQLPVIECTSGRAGPILDTIWTAVQTVNLVVALSKSSAEWDRLFAPNDPPFSRNVGIGLYAGFAAVGAAGMYYGFTRTGACREAKMELAIRASQQPATPAGTWPPTPPPPMAPAAPAPAAPTAPTSPIAPVAPVAPPAPTP